MKPTIDESTKRSVTLLPLFSYRKALYIPLFVQCLSCLLSFKKFNCSGFGSPYVMFIIFISCFALSAASPPELLLNSTYISFVFFLIALIVQPILPVLYCCSDINSELLSSFPFIKPTMNISTVKTY